MMTNRTMRLARGFALLEVLVAAAVLGFGLLAVGRLQFNLFGSSDLAKQRSEAVQLGEQKLEELRSYSLLATYQGYGSSSDTVTPTNASAAYTRTWTIAPSAVTVVGGTYPVYKDVTMTVSWTSRSNTSESVQMNSIIAMADPAAAGQLVVPPVSSPTRKPKSRSLNIPWPAVRLGDGTSAFHPPGSPSLFAIIFNDTTGNVTATCTSASLPGSDNTSGTPTDTNGWGCTSINGLLLAGYICARWVTSGGGHCDVPDHPPVGPPINFHISVTPAPNTSVSGTAVLSGCYDDIGASGTGPEVYPGYVSYACVIDATNSNGAWSGTTTIAGTTFASPPVAYTWAKTRNNWFICRYTANGATYPYVDVTKSLESQNYVLVPGANGNPSCPTGTVQFLPPP